MKLWHVLLVLAIVAQLVVALLQASEQAPAGKLGTGCTFAEGRSRR